MCADGAANRLMTNEHATRPLLPDYVHGDLDSIDPQVRKWMESQGVQVSQNSGQDSTDLDKCLELVQNISAENGANGANGASSENGENGENGRDVSSNILVLGAFGGRLDHEMANLNCAMRWSQNRDLSSMTLFSEHSLAYVLSPGTHIIYPDLHFEGPTCALIPLGAACESVTTTGLKWNLNASRLEFGGLVSTSNAMNSNVSKITVTTSHPLLWTTEIKFNAVLSSKLEGTSNDNDKEISPRKVAKSNL